MSEKNFLNSVKLDSPNKNIFDMSHDVKLSFKSGQLVPIMCMRTIPGDKFTIGCESLIRFAPLISPVMHRMDVTMHYFFVPCRLIWENFEKWITNTPLQSTDELPAFPTITVSGDEVNPLMDYFGIPTGMNPDPLNSETISALPFAAYQLIYKEYYRDQNLQEWNDTDVLVDGDNGAIYEGWLGQLRNRAWEHDYFTACLPFAQKGESVSLPIGTIPSGQVYNNTAPIGADQEAADSVNWEGNITGSSYFTRVPVTIQNPALGDGYLVTAPQNVDPTTINDLRRAFRLQEWLEKNARGGTRYVEHLLAHFAVRSSDARQQRPEYITGTKSPVTISEVLNTTGTEDLPQGNMAGHGLSVVAGQYGKYYSEEHGYIIGIMSLLPKTAYQQGIPRHFLEINDPTEWPWPTFAHLGEEAVYNKELYAFQGESGQDTFGYLPRYASSRYEPNRVAGDFRNSTLDFWHMGRIFTAPPNLNSEFITSNPTTRIFAVEDGTDYLYAHVLNKVRAVRALPKYGTPTF